MFHNGGFGIKMDIIQINLWNRRTNGLTLIQEACAFCPGQLIIIHVILI